jgi:hypothetical protein
VIVIIYNVLPEMMILMAGVRKCLSIQTLATHTGSTFMVIADSLETFILQFGIEPVKESWR